METGWIDKLINWLQEIEKRDYSWSLNGYDSHKLGAAGLFCKLAKIYENHHSFDRDKLKGTLHKHRRSDGMFEDIPGPKNVIAESRQAMSGLYNLGYEVEKFDASQYFSRPLFFMNPMAWTNPWDAGAQFSHHMFFCKFSNNQDEIIRTLQEVNQYKKDIGWFSHRPPNNVLINGNMKMFTGFDIIGYKIEEEHLKSILDFVLSTHSETGGCNVYDYVYVLAKCLEIDYRVDVAKQQLEKMYNLILEYQQDDGGFSYDKNHSQTAYYGQRITPGLKAGDIHGTTLFGMALSKIDNALDLGLNLSLAVS